jgi:hypothetical protein
MSVVLKSDFDRVLTELQDTQQSLIASLARIEVYRQREKIMSQEIATLRTSQAASQAEAPAGGAAAEESGAGGAATAAATAAAAPGGPVASSTAALTTVPLPAVDGKDAAAASERPAYITEIGEHVPVMLVGGGGRKVRYAAVEGPPACCSCALMTPSHPSQPHPQPPHPRSPLESS